MVPRPYPIQLGGYFSGILGDIGGLVCWHFNIIMNKQTSDQYFFLSMLHGLYSFYQTRYSPLRHPSGGIINSENDSAVHIPHVGIRHPHISMEAGNPVITVIWDVVILEQMFLRLVHVQLCWVFTFHLGTLGNNVQNHFWRVGPNYVLSQHNVWKPRDLSTIHYNQHYPCIVGVGVVFRSYGFPSFFKK